MAAPRPAPLHGVVFDILVESENRVERWRQKLHAASSGRNSACERLMRQGFMVVSAAGLGDEDHRYGHFTSGGIDDRIESTLPPVFSPKMVPRS
jgi:hypothetical protein